MTKDELVYRVQNYKFFRNNNVLFNPDEIYTPANDAQKEIMTSLRVVEGSCSLALASSQEEYTFTPITVTNISSANPAILTVASHSFHTGDNVILNGSTSLDDEYEVTVVSTTSLSIPVSGAGQTAFGTLYHSMTQAFEVYQVRKTGTNYGRLDKKSSQEIDDAREDYGASSAVAQINRYYELFGDTYPLGVQGIPAVDGIVLNLRFYRTPLSFQEISSTVNPLLGAMYDRCLYLGTIKYYIENLESNETQKIAYNESVQLFEAEKDRLRNIITEQRRPRPQGTRSFRL